MADSSREQAKLSPDTLAMLEKTGVDLATMQAPARSSASDADGFSDQATLFSRYRPSYTGDGRGYAQRAANALEAADVKFQPCASLQNKISLSPTSIDTCLYLHR
jgi:hypothetical protein